MHHFNRAYRFELMLVKRAHLRPDSAGRTDPKDYRQLGKSSHEHVFMMTTFCTQLNPPVPGSKITREEIALNYLVYHHEAASVVLKASVQAAMKAAGSGELKHWELHETPLLALIILLDQYPRVLYRGTPREFASDIVSRAVIRRAADNHVCILMDRFISLVLRTFKHNCLIFQADC